MPPEAGLQVGGGGPVSYEKDLLVTLFLPAAERAGQGVMHFSFFFFSFQQVPKLGQ